MLPMALAGWHRGERSIREKLQYTGDPSTESMWQWIADEIDPGAAQFHAECHFLPITTLDSDGRPWSSILAPKGGMPGSGFIRYIGRSQLRVTAEVWDGEPILRTGRPKMLVAGIGIHFPTRTRNKIAGYAERYSYSAKNRSVELDFRVNETIGNCPKYINIRHFTSHSDTRPTTTAENLDMKEADRLPDELIDFILASDTVFFGSTYSARDNDAERFPSHLGMNQRGGRPGFIRVSKKDGRTLAMPDYSGNRFMTSLGNVEATPLASFTFIDFETGAILYLTGNARNLFGDDAKRMMPMHNRYAVTTLFVTGYTFVLDALPVRLTSGKSPIPSPYSPPIRYLAEEDGGRFALGAPEQTALLSRVEIHSPSIATFWFQPSKPLPIIPGQAVILSFVGLLGQPRYAHMAQSNPKSVNDDRIRTWTVSASTSTEFALTMREIPGGVVTGAIFNLARNVSKSRPELLSDTTGLGIRLGVVGVSGTFCLPTPEEDAETKLLWLAGGIGLTPFLSMLRSLRTNNSRRWDIHMVLSTHDPEAFLPLLTEAAEIPDDKVKFHLDVFVTGGSKKNSTNSNGLVQSVDTPDLFSNLANVLVHNDRVDSKFLQGVDVDRVVYLCGPKPFEKSILNGLSGRIHSNRIEIEGFEHSPEKESSTTGAMDIPLPSTRELELEMLLREKDNQLVQLSDELSLLKLHLVNQPPPSTTEPITLPPTFASLILKHIPRLPQILDPAGGSTNSTTAALTQRVRVLQDENDELYDILKKEETGRLMEEVQSLKRIVLKLEDALRESHQVIVSLSTELDKAYQTFNSAAANSRTTSPSNAYHNSNGARSRPRSVAKQPGGGGRLPPTGPRAHSHKKQRLSHVDQEESSPSMRSNVSLPSSAHPGSSGRRGRSRSRSPEAKSNVKMEVDEPTERSIRTPERARDRERWDRDRERSDRSRGRERDRDGNRSKRIGGGGKGTSRRGGGDRERGSHSLHNNGSSTAQGSVGNGPSGDRTLAERMGLEIG
ncbi:hypothetical protein D9757_002689 [Collybiopsis confluens]|uniref:FAD-binding FR-type domain-containing protein n=1 Tax=Collybiopsis confluens TaxID=2823264 RepID=A0A8H5HWP8_9AGAR|nr:hypothetical protein D9757_002689 [Collybiopsis confluens]